MAPLAEDLPQFKAIFAGQDGEDAAWILGNWFCQTFVASPELQGAALQTMQRLGQTLSGGHFRGASWAVHQLSEKDEGAGRRWKALLVFLGTGARIPYLPGSAACSCWRQPDEVGLRVVGPFLCRVSGSVSRSHRGRWLRDNNGPGGRRRAKVSLWVSGHHTSARAPRTGRSRCGCWRRW